MPNHPTLAAAFVTLAVIAPAGWRALDADIQSDGKRLRPLQQSFTVDGTRITLDVDRHVVMTGDTVTATLVALGERPSGPALVDSFKIYVTPHGKKPPRHDYDDRLDYDSGVSEGYA